jgi:hypothetical protein
VGLDSGLLAGHIGKDLVGLEPARDFAPPHTVVGLLELALLLQIQHGQQEESRRGEGQQRRL